MPDDPPTDSAALEAASALLHRITTEDGLLASPVEERNYRRVWARDGVVCGLAGLAAGDEAVTAGLRRTLDALAASQGPDGQIPSNIRFKNGEPVDVSYGGLAGRVDAGPWFVVGLTQYVRATGDEAFGRKHRPAARRSLDVLRTWEFNDRGLVYVPLGGDWADEYVLHGYVLFDQVLRLWAQRGFAAVFGEDPDRDAGASRTAEIIARTFAPDPETDPDATYHPHAYRRYVDRNGAAGHWLAGLSPSGYQTQFDALGNALAVLLGLGSDSHRRRVLDTGERIRKQQPGGLVPAFWPPIREGDDAWPALTENYRDVFSNEPGHYHNGGLWPMVNGWWGMALAAEGRTDAARDLLGALHDANRVEPGSGTDRFLFPEYRDAGAGLPHGTCPLGWSAAAALLLAVTLDELDPPLDF
jgi:hypothetical protein